MLHFPNSVADGPSLQHRTTCLAACPQSATVTVDMPHLTARTRTMVNLYEVLLCEVATYMFCLFDISRQGSTAAGDSGLCLLYVGRRLVTDD